MLQETRVLLEQVKAREEAEFEQAKGGTIRDQVHSEARLQAVTETVRLAGGSGAP